MEQQKTSTLTLRLNAAETALLEKLKARTGRSTSSDTIRYLLMEYEQLCQHVADLQSQKQYLVKQYAELEAQHEQLRNALRVIRTAIGEQ